MGKWAIWNTGCLNPIGLEAGIEAETGYLIAPGFQVSGAVRKSILTSLTDNKRRLDSASATASRVHSSWPLYDL